jgi:CheY-like chemotaxis protein
MERRLVAIVDDDSGVRLPLKFFLEASGYRTVEYGSGEELLDALRGDKEIDTIIMDTHMSGRDGYEICEDFRPKRPDLFVIGCSGDGWYSDAWIESGADVFLTKPFEYDVLLRVIGNREV